MEITLDISNKRTFKKSVKNLNKKTVDKLAGLFNGLKFSLEEAERLDAENKIAIQRLAKEVKGILIEECKNRGITLGDVLNQSSNS